MFNRSQFILLYAPDNSSHFITSKVLNMLNIFEYGIQMIYLQSKNVYS